MIYTSGSAPGDRILCYYVNETRQVELARIVNVPNWRFERVVFPRQRLLFEASHHAVLEVHTCTPDVALLKQFPCLRLQVWEKVSESPELFHSAESLQLSE
jgi:hypothetical protein